MKSTHEWPSPSLATAWEAARKIDAIIACTNRDQEGKGDPTRLNWASLQPASGALRLGKRAFCRCLDPAPLASILCKKREASGRHSGPRADILYSRVCLGELLPVAVITPKHNKKSGGKAPKSPAPGPAPGHSSNEEEAMAELKRHVWKPLKKEKRLRKAGLADGGGTSGTAAPTRTSTRKGREERLKQFLSFRLSALERTTDALQVDNSEATVVQEEAVEDSQLPQAPAGPPTGPQASAGEPHTGNVVAGDSTQWAGVWDSWEGVHSVKPGTPILARVGGPSQWPFYALQQQGAEPQLVPGQTRAAQDASAAVAFYGYFLRISPSD